ncbi:protein maelstrom homolog [Wyeomyia smithii]|uniref:protein maelstrom homolog n=1 Tax=Wyeomyia smithii TaxID=174621 RepID=UPI002467BD0A|nr:protein maelstrom homolog [Wyeomyia smithii]
MPKKSTAKGPFFFFMLEFRKREEAKGKHFLGGMDQLMRAAGPHWDTLSTDERETYKDRAKAYKQSPKLNFGEKYTSQGIPFSQIEREKQARLKKEQSIRRTVSELIQTAAGNNALDKMEVFLISFNYFCKTTAEIYIPAEMAIIRYSLEQGVIDKLHMFINPGNIPLGLAYEANILSEETHRLPTPPDAMGETNFEEIFEKILDFTQYKDKKHRLFFAEEKQAAVVENILEQLANESKFPGKFVVCPLGDFFFQLKRASEREGLDICLFPAKTVADILLKKDNYEYTGGIACEFHEKLEVSRFCCLSKIIRLSYIISDSCCLDLNIEMVAGRHLPMNADTTLCSDFSETESRFHESDRLSFVSSSDLTHVSLPKMQKLRSKSPFRGAENESCPIIYSSRAVASVADAADKCNVSTNPFHDLKSEPPTLVSHERKSATPKAVTNPFSRQVKLETVRQPRGIGVVGHGRGSLLSAAGSSTTAPGFESPLGLALFRGIGRGLGISSNVSTISSKQISDNEDD